MKQSEKNEIWDRQNGRCWKCKHRLELSSVQYHHIKHKSDGGDDSLRNIRAVCANCHSKIHNKDNLRKTSTKKKKSVNLVPSYNGGLLG